MLHLVTATFTSPIPKNAPGEIVYIPVGTSKINATVGGKPGEITVNVPADKGVAIAASLQKALAERLESPVRPRLAFDHSKTGPASGHPASFTFDPERGIILSASWSNAGRNAIEGGDYGYFSPTFLIDDNGFPSGLPSKGEIGSLVDEPAFRTIGLIAAADTDPNPDNKPSTYMKLVLAHLGIDPAHESAESSAVAKIKSTETELSTVKASNVTLETENAALKAKVEAAEATAATARKERADTLVKAAINDGRIAPKDTELHDKYRARIEAGDTFAEDILAQLPKLNAGLGTPILGGGSDCQVAGEHAFETKAKALVTAGSAKTLDEALGLVAASDSSAYGDYLATLKG